MQLPGGNHPPLAPYPPVTEVALRCTARLGRSVVVVERFTAASHASGRAEGLFKSVQTDELRTRLTQRSIEKAVSFADWAGVPLQVARSGSFLIARTCAAPKLIHHRVSHRWHVSGRIPLTPYH